MNNMKRRRNYSSASTGLVNFVSRFLGFFSYSIHVRLMMIVSWQIIFIVYRFPITVCLPQSNLSSQIDKLNVKNASVNKLFIVHHILLLVAIVISNFMMRLRYGRKKVWGGFFEKIGWVVPRCTSFIHSLLSLHRIISFSVSCFALNSTWTTFWWCSIQIFFSSILDSYSTRNCFPQFSRIPLRIQQFSFSMDAEFWWWRCFIV